MLEKSHESTLLRKIVTCRGVHLEWEKKTRTRSDHFYYSPAVVFALIRSEIWRSIGNKQFFQRAVLQRPINEDEEVASILVESGCHAILSSFPAPLICSPFTPQIRVFFLPPVLSTVCDSIVDIESPANIIYIDVKLQKCIQCVGCE